MPISMPRNNGGCHALFDDRYDTLHVGVAACGGDPGTRAVTGGLIGAGAGAGVSAMTGGRPATGALIGGGVGAVVARSRVNQVLAYQGKQPGQLRCAIEPPN